MEDGFEQERERGNAGIWMIEQAHDSRGDEIGPWWAVFYESVQTNAVEMFGHGGCAAVIGLWCTNLDGFVLGVTGIGGKFME